MLRIFVPATSLLLLSLQGAFAAVADDAGANAALKYWQAFATLPRMAREEEEKLHKALTVPVDGQAPDLAQAEYALQMLHRGAALTKCDWGIGYEDGVFLRLPQVNAARVLSSFACMRARKRFEEGKHSEAIDDLVAAMTLSRHLSREGGFIPLLVGYQIEARMIETLAEHLPKLNAETNKKLQ